jgi:hypothetical protein
MGGVISCLRKSAPITSSLESKASRPAAPAGPQRGFISTAVPMVHSRSAANDLQDNLQLILSYCSRSSPDELEALMRQVIESHPERLWSASDLQHVFNRLTDPTEDVSIDQIQALATGLCTAHQGRLAPMALNCEAADRKASSPERAQAFHEACTRIVELQLNKAPDRPDQ